MKTFRTRGPLTAAAALTALIAAIGRALHP